MGRLTPRRCLRYSVILVAILMLIILTNPHLQFSVIFQEYIVNGTLHYRYGDGITLVDISSYDNLTVNPVTRFHVGVLTRCAYFDTRISAIQKTWGKSLPYNLKYYVGDCETAIKRQLPDSAVSLQAVEDDVYPPRLKSFSMMQYWCKYLLSQYDWFVRVDDDVYINVQALDRLLYSLDPKKKYYIGRNGDGIPFEKESLGLHGKTFCTGPTVIYSKSTMETLCPHLQECSRDNMTSHEDTEVGRCLINNLQMQCAVSKKGPYILRRLRNLFFHPFNQTDIYKNATALTTILRGGAVSMHKVNLTEFKDVHHRTMKFMFDAKDDKWPKHKGNLFRIYHIATKRILSV